MTGMLYSHSSRRGGSSQMREEEERGVEEIREGEERGRNKMETMLEPDKWKHDKMGGRRGGERRKGQTER